jgi:hypothetical protein
MGQKSLSGKMLLIGLKYAQLTIWQHRLHRRGRSEILENTARGERHPSHVIPANSETYEVPGFGDDPDCIMFVYSLYLFFFFSCLASFFSFAVFCGFFLTAFFLSSDFDMQLPSLVDGH